MTVLDGPASGGTGTLDANGQAVITLQKPLGAGLHSLTASYAGVTGFSPSTSPAYVLTVDHAPVTVTLTAQPTSLNYGQATTLTAGVRPAAAQSTGVPPTGSVNFVDGTQTVGTGQIDSTGNAVLNLPKVSGGSHSYSAIYSNDTNYSGGQSPAVPVVVATASTSISLTSSVNPATLNQTVVLTATVNSTVGTPTGKVAFQADGVQPGSWWTCRQALRTYNFTPTTIKTYNLTAAYQGDGNFAPVNSNAISEVVNGATATMTLSSSQNPSTDKSPVTFTARLSFSASQQPTGYVTFLDGTNTIGSGQIVSGQAVLTTNTLTGQRAHFGFLGRRRIVSAGDVQHCGASGQSGHGSLYDSEFQQESVVGGRQHPARGDGDCNRHQRYRCQT